MKNEKKTTHDSYAVAQLSRVSSSKSKIERIF